MKTVTTKSSTKRKSFFSVWSCRFWAFSFFSGVFLVEQADTQDSHNFIMGNHQSTFERIFNAPPEDFIPGATPRSYVGFFTGQPAGWVDQPPIDRDNWPGIFVLQAKGSELRIVARHEDGGRIKDVLAVKIIGGASSEEILRYIKGYYSLLGGNGLTSNNAIYQYIRTKTFNGGELILEEDWQRQNRMNDEGDLAVFPHEMLQPTQQTADNVQFDVVLVHGLGDNPENCWSYHGQQNWPEVCLFANGFGNDYLHPARVMRVRHNLGTVNNRATIRQTVDDLLNYLEDALVGERPVIWFGHSLGGLLVKEILRTAEKRNTRIYLQTRGIIFFGTPHFGSNLAAGAGALRVERHLDAFLNSFGLGTHSPGLEYLQPTNPGLAVLNEWLTRTPLEYLNLIEDNPVPMGGIALMVVDRNLCEIENTRGNVTNLQDFCRGQIVCGEDHREIANIDRDNVYTQAKLRLIRAYVKRWLHSAYSRERAAQGRGLPPAQQAQDHGLPFAQQALVHGPPPAHQAQVHGPPRAQQAGMRPRLRPTYDSFIDALHRNVRISCRILASLLGGEHMERLFRDVRECLGHENVTRKKSFRTSLGISSPLPFEEIRLRFQGLHDCTRLDSDSDLHTFTLTLAYYQEPIIIRLVPDHEREAYIGQMRGAVKVLDMANQLMKAGTISFAIVGGILFMGSSVVVICALLVAVVGAFTTRQITEEITGTFREYAADISRIRNLVAVLNDELVNVFNEIDHSGQSDDEVIASFLRAEDSYSNLIMALLVASCRDNMDDATFRTMANDGAARNREMLNYRPYQRVIAEVNREIRRRGMIPENVDDNDILRIIGNTTIERRLANAPL